MIGANAYPDRELENAVQDASHVADALRKRAFSVATILDPDRSALDAAISEFRILAQAADIACIYLAGHAVERHGAGFFLPVDFPFPLKPGTLRHYAIGLNDLVSATEGAGSRIVMLDACRNWPEDSHSVFQLSSDLDQLVEAERNWPNLLLAYATSAATVAGDGLPGKGGAFANSMCLHLLDHNLTVDECFRRVSQDVIAQRKQQQPWTYSSLANTLSFTDLPRYTPIHRHAIPNPQNLGDCVWTAPDVDGGVIVGMRDALAWRRSQRR